MKNDQYWKKRFVILEKAQENTGYKYTKTLEQEYKKAIYNIEKDITKWYTRLAVNNETTLDEAKKILNTSELQEFKWTVEEYIKRGQENGISQQWAKELENASARVHISRLDALKVNVQNEIEQLYGKQGKGVNNLERNIYMDTYYHSAYEIQKGLNVGWNVPRLEEDNIGKILSKPWTTDNLTFSDRIWKNKNELIGRLQAEFTQVLIRGGDLTSVINTISKRMNVDKSKAGRLVMTESAFFSSLAQKDCFDELGVKKYEMVATLDTRTSEICQELDGKVFNMKDYAPGITAPPFHVWCRSSTCPYFEDNQGERAVRGEDGNTHYISSNIKYKEWYNKYVDREEGIASNRKNSNTETKDVSSKKNAIIEQSFNNKNIKQIALNTNIESIKVGGNKSYHRKANLVFKDGYDKHTVLHEIGHAVDYNNKWISSSKNFVEAINIDRQQISNDLSKYKNLIKKNEQYAELSDIIGGITDNKIVGRYKHSKQYWKKPNKLEREVFAQLFSLAGDDDIYQLEVFQKYLPNVFKEFDNLMRRLL